MSAPAFRIFNASAGSGKTFNLVKEYLILLFQSQIKLSPSQVLAITFTNKAAAEMKERLLEKMQSFAAGNLEPPANEVMQATGLNRQSFIRRSKELLDLLLFDYDSLQFGTIDRFTYRIIRTFARELDISLSSDVEMNDSGVIKEIIDDFLLKINKDSPSFRWLLRMTEEKLEDDKHWDIAFDLKISIPWFIISDAHLDLIESLEEIKPEKLHEILNEAGKEAGKLKLQIKEKAEELLSILTPLQEKIARFGNYEKALKQIAKGHYDKIFSATFAKLMQGITFKKNRTVDPAILANIIRKTETLYHLIRQHFTWSILKKSMNPLGVYSTILQETRLYKEQNDKIFISDFNKILRRVVKDTDAPFIYWRLGEKYRHFFIDEFQDTSVLQWQNLIPLMSDVLARHTGYPYAGLNLLGDAKQSIYRFRGGDPEQFIRLSHNGENPFHVQPETINLNRNWRSAKNIVRFNNMIFPPLAKVYLATDDETPDIQKLYLRVYREENVRQAFREDAPEGYVQVDLESVENEDAYAQKIWTKVRSIMEEGYAPGDICILTDRNDQMTALARTLMENGIKTVSENALALKASAKLQLLHALYRYAVQPAESLLPAVFLWHATVKNRYWSPEISLTLKGKKLHDVLGVLTDKTPENIPDIYRLYDFFIFLTEWLELDDKNEEAHLRRFFDIINRLPLHQTNPTAYWQAWENRIGDESIPLNDDAQAIRLMTVHKAKGLEFPVVIYTYGIESFMPKLKGLLWTENTGPFSDEIPYLPVPASDLKKWALFDQRQNVIYREEILKLRFDALNRLYVALTRPVEQLYLVPFIKKNKNNTLPGLLTELKNIPELSDNFDETTQRWEAGQKIKHKETSIQHNTRLKIPSAYHSVFNTERLHINTKKTDYWTEMRKQPVEQGLRIHHYLALIRHTTDWPSVEKIIRASEPEQAKSLIALIEKILTEPEPRKFFEPHLQVFIEREIRYQGKILRPDRFTVIPGTNRVMLLDYKTGKSHPEHQKQMLNYAEALKATGMEIVEARLLYLDPGKGEVNSIKVIEPGRRNT